MSILKPCCCSYASLRTGTQIITLWLILESALQVAAANVDLVACDLLTLGQTREDGTPLICPAVTRSLSHCCYTLTRDPYCCNETLFIIHWILTLIVWLTLPGMIIYWLYKKSN